MSTLTMLLGTTLMSHRGQHKTEAELQGKRIIGLYFMLSTCRQCEKFTPALATMYRNMTLPAYKDLDMKRSFDVVVVSGDCDSLSFRQKLLQMPFLVMPFYRRPTVSDLYKRYDVKSVPTLIFVDENGDVIERDGRSLVDSHFNDLHVIWGWLQRKRDRSPTSSAK